MKCGEPIVAPTWVKIGYGDPSGLAPGDYHDECARALGIDVDSLPDAPANQ
jgi:hypothetical protein